MKLKHGLHYSIVPLKWETYKESIAANGLFVHFEIRKENPTKEEWTLEIAFADDGEPDQVFPSIFKAKKAAREYYLENIQQFVDQVLRK